MKHMKLIILLALAVFSFSCTKLDEELRGSLEQASSSVTAEGLLQSAYFSMNEPIAGDASIWALSEHTTDACLGPTRGPDWDDNGVWRAVHLHTWDADHGFVRDNFRRLLQIQFAASSVLDKSPSAQQGAEARFIRAVSMFYVLDGWNQVPYRSDLQDLTKLPETLVGNDASDFIISELNAILNDLPDGPAIKANKDAARFLLMKMYLNKGTFADRGNPSFPAGDMDQVISLADQILNSGKYSFTSNFFDTFAPDNYTNASKSKEIIFAFENTNGVTTFGNGEMVRWIPVLHYNQKPSGWNGFATLSDFYDKYEAADKRRDDSYPGVTDVSGLRMGYLIGQQYDQNGVALKDRKGNPLSFTREVKIKETGNDLEVTGIRVLKYPPDYVKEFPAENEHVAFRYADVLLMKAEALLRKGDAAGGLTLVNMIRTDPSRNASALATLTIDNLLDERGRELAWEGWRRNDLIRFGKFLQPDQARPDASGPERLLFPIPNEQLSVNPNLSQNPGYN